MLVDHRHADREDPARPDALDDPGADELRQVRGTAPSTAAIVNTNRPARKTGVPAERVGDPARRRLGDAEREEVRGDEPFDAARGPQLTSDPRERERHDALLERDAAGDAPAHARIVTDVNSSVQEVSPPQALTGVADLVLDVVPRAMRRVRAEMRAAGTEGAEPGATSPAMTVPQLRALLFVRRRPDTGLSGVAEHLGESLPACSALVDRLVRGGLLDRSTDPDERRRIRLRLTSDGEARVANAQQRARRWLEREIAELSATDRERLIAGLGILRQIATATDAGTAATRVAAAR